MVSDKREHLLEPSVKASSRSDIRNHFKTPKSLPLLFLESRRTWTFLIIPDNSFYETKWNERWEKEEDVAT